MTDARRQRAEEMLMPVIQKTMAGRNVIFQAYVASPVLEIMLQFAAECVQAERERCAACVPTNWLDPLLTGMDKVVSDKVNCQEIEAVLLAVKLRIERSQP